MQVFRIKNVPRHQSSAENRGEVKEKRHLVAVPEIAAGQHVRRHAGEPEPQDGSHGRHKNRNAIGPQQLLRNAEQHFVCVQRDGFREEPVAVQLDGILLGHGAAEHQQERQQARRRKRREHRIGKYVEQNTVPADRFFCASFCARHGQGLLFSGRRRLRTAHNPAPLSLPCGLQAAPARTTGRTGKAPRRLSCRIPAGPAASALHKYRSRP